MEKIEILEIFKRKEFEILQNGVNITETPFSIFIVVKDESLQYRLHFDKHLNLISATKEFYG